MMKTWKRFLAIFLTALLIMPTVSTASTVQAKGAGKTKTQESSEEKELELSELDPATLHVKKLGETEDEPAIDGTAEDPDALLRVSVFLKDPGAADAGYSTQNIGTNSAAASYRSRIEAQQNALASRIESTLGYSINVKWNLTLLTNAFSCYVKAKDIAAIKKMDSVRSVEREIQYEAPVTNASDSPNTANTSSGMVGATAAWEDGYSGAGSRIAIIDTGVDTSHQSFNADAFSQHISELGKTSELMTQANVSAVRSQLHSGSANYVSAKIPYGYNYIDNNTTINHLSDTAGEHGSHVAGIATANYYIKSGSSYLKAAENVHAVGMAPDAQLLVMKVFGAGGGAYDSDYFAAIEDAIVLGCDSVNLSLGSADPGWTYAGSYQSIMNKLASANNPNLVVTISAGNSYGVTDHLTTDLYIEDVYKHSGGSPGTFLTSLGVAAAENIGATGSPLTFNGSQTVFYTETESTGAAMTSIAGSYNYVYIDAVGNTADYSTVNNAESLSGKIVIVNRGELSFYEKGNNLKSYSPKALIVANNQSGSISMDLTDYTGTFPMVSITLADAEEIKANSTRKTAGSYTYYTGSVTVTSTTQSGATTTRDKAEITDFSSWGVPGSLVMKPEITAPGGDIYSVWGTNKTSSGTAGGSDKYVTFSGTSMAAPHMAGLAAITAQYLRENDFSQKNPSLTGAFSNRAIIQSLLMSTATPMKEGSVYYPILRQGAGLAEVHKAITASSVIMMDEAGLTTSTGAAADGKVKAEFGDDPDRTGVYQYSFTIYNISDTDLTFDLRTELFTQGRYTEDGEVFMDNSTANLASTASYVWESIGQDAETHDVDRDGDTDNADAQAILDYLTGETAASALDLGAADMDGDGKVTTKDALLLIDWEPEAGSVGANEVPAGQKRKVTVTIRLTDAQKSTLNAEYPCGAYIEGFTYVTCNTTGGSEGLSYAHEHSIPLLGFYGSWTDPSMFDNTSYTDTLYGTAKTPYSGNTDTNYLTITSNGTTGKFSGNPYMVEESFPTERLAVNSTSKFGTIYYNLVRAAGTTGLAVSKLDGIGGNVTSVLASNVTGNEVVGIYYHVNQAAWYNLSTKNYSVNKTVSSYGLAEGDVFRIGFYAIPEYNAMLYNQNDLTSADAGVLGSAGFKAVLESNRLGRGAFVGYDFVVDDTAPEILSASLNGNTLTVQARDNRNLAYVAVMSTDGSVIYTKAAPGTAEYSTSVDISDAVQNANGYVAVFTADYAGNETAAAVKVNDHEGGEKTVYVLTNELTTGEDYLIVNTNSAGTGYALYYTLNATGSTATTAALTVDIKAGNGTTQNQPYVEIVSDAKAVWSVQAGSTSGTYSFVNNGWYLRRSSSNNLTITKDTSRRDWNWDGTNNRLSTNSRYLRYYNNTFSINTATNSVYLYRKTTVEQSSDPFAVQSVTVTPNTLDLYKGSSADLTAEVLPLTAENRNVTWSSSNSSIATVDETGHVTAVSAGTATITAKSEEDPSIAGTCAVTVTSVNKALNGIVWDEESQVYFSSFNANSLPTWTKLHNDAKDLELASAFMANASTLYAGTLNSSAETVLYTVNRSSYALTEFGTNYVGAFGMARASSQYTDYFVYGYASYLIFGNLTPETDEDAGGTFSGIPYGLLNLSETDVGDAYVVGVAARNVGSTSSGFYFLDATGKIWQTTMTISSGVSFGTPTLVVDTGISTSYFYQSLYYDGTYLYWSHQTDEIAELIIINASTKMVYHAGNFGENVWPVGGLYVNGSAAPASEGDAPEGAGETLEGLTLQITREELMTEEVMRRFSEDAAKFSPKTENEPVGGLNTIRRLASPKAIHIGSVTRSLTPGTPENGETKLVYTEETDVTNGLIEITYDPAKLTYVSARSDLAFKSFHADTDNGKITFAYASKTAVTAGTTLAEFVFESVCEAETVTVLTKERNDDLALSESATAEVPGTGHDYVVSGWTWIGNDDEGYTAATAAFVCQNDTSHTLTRDAEVTSAPGEGEYEGYMVYTAAVTLNGQTYNDYKYVFIHVPVEAYYLIGDMTNWAVDEAYRFEENSQNAGEYYLATELAAGNQIKVVRAVDGVAQNQDYYPSAEHNYNGKTDNYVVDTDHSGYVTVYFKPAGSPDSGWQPFGGFFFIEKEHLVEVQVPEGHGTAYAIKKGNSEAAVSAPFLMDMAIIAEADEDYELDRIELWKTNGQNGPELQYTLDGNEFTMPDYDVIFKVYFKALVWEFTGFTWEGSDESGYTAAAANYTTTTAAGETLTRSVDVIVTTATTQPTCEEAGKTVYTAAVTAENSLDGEAHSETKEVTIPALGHTPADPVTENNVDPTCEEDGNYDLVTYCSVCGKELSRETVTVPATGHDYALTGWSWTGSDAEGYTAAKAIFTCKNDATHVEEVNATVTSETTDATCEEAGKTVYTAEAVFNNDTYTDTKEVAIQALGHDYELTEWTWTEEYLWTETDWNSITEDDVIAVTMTLDGVTYILTSVNGNNALPPARTVTLSADGKSFRTKETDESGWIREAVDGGYRLHANNGQDAFLRTSNNNNQLRVGTIGTNTYYIVNLDEATNYLTLNTTAGAVRYLGVYNKADWRTYTSLHTNIAGQELQFWKLDGTVKAATATFTCKNDPSHVEVVEAEITSETTDPTCELAGGTVYTATAVFEGETYTDVKEETVPALGHKWHFEGFTWAGDDAAGYTGAVANYICENDATHTAADEASFTKESMDASCTEPGTVTYTAAVSAEDSRDGEAHSESRTVTGAPLGHDYELTEWVWAEDFSTAKAVFTCKNDTTHVEEVDANVTSETTDPTCEEAGKTVYTAAVTFEEKEYTDTKEVAIQALGHTYEFTEWVWAEDFSTAKAIFTCKNDTTHVEEVDADVTSETTEATAEEDGKIVYTAKVTFEEKEYTDTKEVVIPAWGWKWTRLAGSNRYQTTALAVQEVYEDGSCTTLIVASGQAFPDALAGAALAGVYECPILLTNKTKLSPDTKSEILRLAAPGCRVLILGGNGAVSADVEQAINDLGIEGLTTERVKGSNREATSIEVYKAGKEAGGFKAGGTVIIATGYSFADALSISPYAYASKTPILLAKKDGSLNPDVKALIEEEGFTKAIIIGGKGVVSLDTEAWLAEKLQVLRLSGSNRYVTSAEIMKWELGQTEDAIFQPEAEMTIDNMGVATGSNFADALGSVGLLGRTASPLLLVSDSNATNWTATEANIEELIHPFVKEMTRGYIFGGSKAVSPAIEELLNAAVQ